MPLPIGRKPDRGELRPIFKLNIATSIVVESLCRRLTREANPNPATNRNAAGVSTSGI
jgi:hypothetical protein